MIFFIVTTSVFNNCSMRKQEYTQGIQKLKQMVGRLFEQDAYKIIVVENNGEKNTFLNTLHDTVYYTENNFIPTRNKGIKELKDVWDCIEKYKIKDTDFIVKMTGRYILQDDSEFIKTVQHLKETRYECIIKYGAYFRPLDFKTNDCITGLIGMSCSHVKQIKMPTERECVEWNWAKVTNSIQDEKIYKVHRLGIRICPGSHSYFWV